MYYTPVQSGASQGQAESPLELDLARLLNGHPGLTAHEGGSLAECALVSLDSNGHSTPVSLAVRGSNSGQYEILGSKCSAQMRDTHADPRVATEKGACGIAILLMEDIAGLVVCRRTPAEGEGFDYWMALPGACHDEDNFIAGTTRLEVSGIRLGTDADIRSRVKSKANRLQGYASPLPARIVVVEFSRPVAQVEPG